MKKVCASMWVCVSEDGLVGEYVHCVCGGT